MKRTAEARGTTSGSSAHPIFTKVQRVKSARLILLSISLRCDVESCMPRTQAKRQRWSGDWDAIDCERNSRCCPIAIDAAILGIKSESAEPLRAAQVSPARGRLGTHICCGFLTALSESRGASWGKNRKLLSCCVCAKRIELLCINGHWRGRGISGLLLFLRQYILVIGHIVVAAFSQFCVQGRDRRRVKEWMSATLPRNDGVDRRVRRKTSEQRSRSRDWKLAALVPQNVQMAIQEQQET